MLRSATPLAAPPPVGLANPGPRIAVPPVRAPGRSESSATYLRRRIVAAAILAALLALVGLALWGLPSPAEHDIPASVLDDVSAVVLVVEPGETLWAIARDLQPVGDIRPLVDAMSEIVGRSSLQAGQEIRIPAELLGGG